MWSVELKIAAPASEVFRSLGRREGAFWIDRAPSDGASFMSFAPKAQLWVEADGRARHADEAGIRIAPGDPIEALAAFIRDAEPFSTRTGAPRTVGFLGFDLGPVLESHLAARAHEDPSMPRAFLARYDAVVSCVPTSDDPEGRCRILIEAVDEAAGRPILEAITTDPPPANPAPHPARLVEAPGWVEYEPAIEKALEYIAAGDVYQVNIARRFRVESDRPPADTYLDLRARQPVPYGAFVDCGRFAILSNSPERFLQVKGDAIRTEPIKGTRRRHSSPEVDHALGVELRADPKERAEHVMIVDLERNDLGRIAERGSVHVTSLLRLESFATLHHLVSTVEARLEPDTDLPTILRATFPGGSITGAPKIRATEVIEELEPHGRGLYTGSLLWFRDEADFDSSIAIRTAVARDGTYAYHAGGGIVADSDPRREYEECWLKARAFLAALFGSEEALRLTADHMNQRPRRTDDTPFDDARRSAT